MKIFGIGTDIVNINRIEKSLKKGGNKFKEKIFTKKEIVYCDKKKNSASFYAKRFAAKEAFSKAAGTGIRRNVSFKNIEILNNKYGQPFIKLQGKTESFLKKKFKKKKYLIYLSLSDDKPWAQATVLISY
jgi:holo-[acyl-carrier protein] synthase